MCNSITDDDERKEENVKIRMPRLRISGKIFFFYNHLTQERHSNLSEEKRIELNLIESKQVRYITLFIPMQWWWWRWVCEVYNDGWFWCHTRNPTSCNNELNDRNSQKKAILWVSKEKKVLKAYVDLSVRVQRNKFFY